jgi:flagellar protein FlaG
MNLDPTIALDRELKDMFSAKQLNDAKVVKAETKTVLENPMQVKVEDEKVAEEEKEPKDNQLNTEAIQKSLESINQFIPIINTNLVFEFDDLNDPPIIKVIDKESKELIREIPSRELDKLAKAFSEMADNLNKSGALFNTEI